MLKRVAVLGAGTMGSGIAQWFAQSGLETEIYDGQIEQGQRAIESIHRSWDKLAQKGKFSNAEIESFKRKLSLVEQFNPKADLFLEAIVENASIKIEVFQKYHRHFRGETIFATNTSSIPIDVMAKELPSSRRERFLGLHFFNPATVMKLVEIVQGHWSTAQLCQDLKQWFRAQGKMPALCQDGPGFIVNRLARNFYGESLRIAGLEDLQKIKEIDRTLKEVGGFPMGPFELMDLIGIDINYAVTESVWKSFYQHNRFAPHPLQQKMVASGRLGKKTKQGFYPYD